MKPNEENFLDVAILQGLVKESDKDRLREWQAKSGLSLFSILVKEKMLTIEQISFLHKSLAEKTANEKKTVSQITQSVEGILTLVQKEDKDLSIDDKKTMESDQSVSLEQKKTLDAEDSALNEKNRREPLAKSLEDKKKFGRYSILETLGEGGMGVVYKAYDPSLDRVVALKLITSVRQQSKISIERFLIEAKATAKLNHEHIVKIHDMGEEKGIYYFTMEYIQGDTLEKWIKEKKITRQNALKSFIKICKAIDYAHSNKIVHRDIKPGNIMMDASCEPRIMDFGLAKMEKEDKKLSRTGSPIGTPAYMSPEQAYGKEIGYLSDVYSLGAVLYTILTGIEPFRGDTLLKVLEAVKEKEPIAPTSIKPGLSRDLEIICQKAMAKEQERRYSSAKELAQDIENFLEGDPIIARPASIWYRYSRKFMKNKMIGSLALCCFILFFGGLFFIWQDQSQRYKAVYDSVEKHFHQAEILSFRKKIPLSKNRLEDKDRKEMHQSIQLYSTAWNALENSEYKSKLLPLQQKIQNRIDLVLSQLYEDAYFHYKKYFCKKALKLYQDVRNSMYLIKESKISKERLDTEISDLYQSILEAEKTKDQAKIISYNSRSSRQDIEKAILLLNSSIEKNRENADAFYLRGLLHFRISHKTKAIEDFQECLALEEDHFPAKYYDIKLSIIKYLQSPEYQNKLDAYIDKFEPSLEGYIKEHKTYFYLLQAYQLKLKHNRYGAEEKILLAQKESPLLAEAYFAQANFLSYFLTGEESISFDYSSYMETVSVYSNYERANAALKRCLDLDPNNPMGILLQGKLAWDVFEIKKAIDNFSRLIHDYPTAYLHFLRGCAYLDLEKQDMALVDFQMAKKKLQASETMLDCLICLLLEESGKKQEINAIVENWKKDCFMQEKDVFCEFVNFMMMQRDQSYFIARQNKLYFQKFYTQVHFFLQIPFIILGSKSNSIEEVKTKLPALNKFSALNTGKTSNNQFVKLFMKDTKKIVAILSEKDIFLTPRSLHDFTFLKNIKIIGRDFSNPELFPIEMHHNSAIHYMLNFAVKQEQFLHPINELLKHGLLFNVETQIACAMRRNIMRQKSLLCRQEILEFPDSYYHRSMHYFSMKDWDRSIQDIKMALFLSSQENKYHYALAKILAYQMLENPQKKENKDKILYHLDQAYSLGLQPMNLPLDDPAFHSMKDSIRTILKQYENFANQQLWKELRELREEKRYVTFYNLTKDLTINMAAMPFVNSVESEEINHYYEGLARLYSQEDSTKGIEKIADQMQKAFSPYWQEKIQVKAQNLLLGKGKIIRVALDSTSHFHDIQTAIDMASEGTTIQIAPGIYEGTFALKNGITLQGTLDEKGKPATILRHPMKAITTTAIEGKRIKIMDCHIQSDIYLRHSEVAFSHCIFESTDYLPGSCKGFEIYLFGSTQVKIEKSRIKAALYCFDQSQLILKDSIISDSYESNLIFFDFSRALIQGNDMSKTISNTTYMILLQNSAQAKISQNRIYNAPIGIYIKDDAQAELAENQIYQTQTAIFIQDKANIQLEKNEIFQNQGYGISLPKETTVSLENNIFKENAKGDVEKR